MLKMFVLLIMAHALADFSLQNDAMAKGKNRNGNPGSIPEVRKYVPSWQYWLSAHAMIHGGAVYIVTGSIVLGCAEVVLHWIIDFVKCERWINLHTDQAAHIICRLLYAAYL